MPTHSQDPRVVDDMEDLAQQLHKYQKILEGQFSRFRDNPERLQVVYNRIAQSPFAAQPDQLWAPEPGQRQAYMEHMSTICNMTPSCDDDHMKIAFAAYGALMCLILCIVGEKPPAAERRIMTRFNELSTAWVQLSMSQSPQVVPAFRPSSSMPKRTLQVYESPSNVCSCQLTEEERNVYSVNPMSVVGMQFIFQPDFTEDVAYKVVQLGVTEEKMFYLVQFAGCADSIEVSKAEMEDMLKNSALQVVNSK